MKKGLLVIMAVGSIMAAMAAKKDAVYCWVNGSSVCYRLSEQPVVSYTEEAAVLTINGVEQLRLPMEDISQLTITYGEYKQIPTRNQEVNASEVMPVEKVGKYIRGGRLVIVKDGKMFDAEGRVIDDCRLMIVDFE